MVDYEMGKIILETAVEIIFWIFLAILIYQLLLKIFGHSPTDLTILYTGFGVVLAYLLKITYKIAGFIGKSEEFMDNTKESFRRIKDDINNLKR